MTDKEIRSIGAEIILDKFSEYFPTYFIKQKGKTWGELLEPLEFAFMLGYKYAKENENR